MISNGPHWCLSSWWRVQIQSPVGSLICFHLWSSNCRSTDQSGHWLQERIRVNCSADWAFCFCWKIQVWIATISYFWFQYYSNTLYVDVGLDFWLTLYLLPAGILGMAEIYAPCHETSSFKRSWAVRKSNPDKPHRWCKGILRLTGSWLMHNFLEAGGIGIVKAFV